MRIDGFRVGVDFGTSNTAAVLVWPDGRTRPLLFDGSPVLPSAVHADPGAGLLVGRDAIHAARAGPDRLEPHPKRCIDDGTVLLGGADVPVPDLITAVLRRVATEAARVAGERVPVAVLTCPVGWGSPRRGVLETAAAPVFDDVVLVTEPVAAASYFLAVAGSRIPPGSAAMVYDLGAGTFDASVVRRVADGFEVLATAGLSDVGGLDIDAAIFSSLGADYTQRDPARWARLSGPTDNADRRAARALWDDVRTGKEVLSRTAGTVVHVPLFDDEAPLGRDLLDQLARPILDRTVALSRSVLDTAGVAPADLAGLFLVGGSSRMPLVAQLLHRRIGVAPTVVEQPELVVAEGSLHARPAPRPSTGLSVGLDVGSDDPLAERGETPAAPAVPPARGRRRLAAVALAIALLAAVTVVAVNQWRESGSEGLGRIPQTLRGDCRAAADSAVPGAASALRCRTPGGYEATVGLFSDQDSVDDAYAQALRESGTVRSEGDCAAGGDGEHRYPGAGAAKGRVLCHRADGKTTLLWTDTQEHTVTRIDPAADDRAVRRAWASWTGGPGYPTAAERSLVDVLAGTDCRRVGIADLDDNPGAVAGVACNPQGAGAQAVSYYRFPTLAALQATMDDHAAARKAPTGVACDDGKAAGFLGARRYDLRSVELGVLLCHPGPRSTLVLEWSVESLLVAGRAVGTDARDLAAWWRGYFGPPTATIVAAVNRQSAPPFPSTPERALLAHIPARSRVNCLRPSGEQVRKNIGSAPAVAVVCGPTSGARIVFYYQFPDQATMRTSYGSGQSYGDDCAAAAGDFAGEGAYTRGGISGRLRCGTDTGGGRFLEWTSDRLAIQAFAFQGGDPIAMIDWWRYDAGPT